jgi:RHS repeat-associated protein
MQGMGGWEATVRESDGQSVGLLADHFGNTLATLGVSPSTVTWLPTRVAGYGPVLGYEPPRLSLTVSLAETGVWRGKRMDPTGLYWFGARYYDPVGGRFLSADPLGHSASMSLYDYALNDPVNGLDPDGRCAATSPQYSSIRNAPPPYEMGIAPYMQTSTWTEYISRNGTSTGLFPPWKAILYDPDNLAGNRYATVTEPTGEYFWYVRDTRDGGALADPNYGQRTVTYITHDDIEQQQRLQFLKDAPLILLTLDGGAALLEGMGGRLLAADTLAAKGGIGPVLKGQEGVARAMAEYEAAGGKVFGEQISIRAGGGRTIPDFYGQNAQGIREFIEVKNGPGAALNPNQQRLYPIIQQSGGVPVGANANIPGVVTPGVPIPPTPIRVIPYP